MIGTLTAAQLAPNNLVDSARSDSKMSFGATIPCCSTVVSIRATARTPPPAAKSRKLNSFYEVLRVKRDASQSQIKSAYRNLAKMYHPDVLETETMSDGQEFMAIHNAYETLSDPAARNVYDLSLSVGSGVGTFNNHRSYANHSRFCSTGQRWETDQCW